MVIDVHCIESAEGPHLFCPAADPATWAHEPTLAFLRILSNFMNPEGHLVDPRPSAYMHQPSRMGAWLSSTYGALCTFEVNSQEPHRHLSVAEVEKIGQFLVTASGNFLDSPVSQTLLSDIDDARSSRLGRWQLYGDKVRGLSAIQVETIVRDLDESAEIFRAASFKDATGSVRRAGSRI